MKTGLFFGSFNPIHVGHLIIGNYMAHNTDLDEVWFVVTPQNPLKNSRNLLNEYDRLELANLAVEDNDRLKVSDIEFYLPRPSYTIDTLVNLEEKYPSHTFVPIMGSDTVNSLPKWKNYEEILKKYQVYVYPRLGKDLTFEHPSIRIWDVPVMEISASFIRRSIRNGKSIRYFVPDKVESCIRKWGYYLS